MFFDNGNRYDGHWEKNEITGFGRMIYSNGDMYIGDWFENKRHGYGVFAKVNGDYYEGNWLLDQREGYGTYLFSVNNKIIIGEWSNDMPKTSVLYRLNEEEKDKELNSKGGLLKSTLLKKRLQTDINDLNIRLDNLLLPVLQLENPVEVLEEALNDVKKSRLGFDAMLEYVRENKVNKIVVSELSRLSRDTFNCKELISELYELVV